MHQHKPETEFTTAPSQADGLSSWCKKCHSDKQHELGLQRPLMDAKDSSPYLGELGERLVAAMYPHAIRAPTNNPGYDLTCQRGYNVDVKTGRYQLSIKTFIGVTQLVYPAINELAIGDKIV